MTNQRLVLAVSLAAAPLALFLAVIVSAGLCGQGSRRGPA